MSKRSDAKDWLLTNVPPDIKKIVEDYKDTKAKRCGCRFGNSQAIYSLLRKANKLNLPDAEFATHSVLPDM